MELESTSWKIRSRMFLEYMIDIVIVTDNGLRIREISKLMMDDIWNIHVIFIVNCRIPKDVRQYIDMPWLSIIDDRDDTIDYIYNYIDDNMSMILVDIEDYCCNHDILVLNNRSIKIREFIIYNHQTIYHDCCSTLKNIRESFDDISVLANGNTISEYVNSFRIYTLKLYPHLKYINLRSMALLYIEDKELYINTLTNNISTLMIE